MIAQCCKTCVYYRHTTEETGRCTMRIDDCGNFAITHPGGCCADHAKADGATYAPRESETWQCVGCDHNCRCELDAGFIPVQCLLYTKAWKRPDGMRVGDAKWVRVNP